MILNKNNTMKDLKTYIIKESKSNIQKQKEELRRMFREVNFKADKALLNPNDYIGFELWEKDEDGEYYFIHIDMGSSVEEVKEFFKTPVKSIKSIHQWYAAPERGGDEYITDKDNYGKLIELRNNK